MKKYYSDAITQYRDELSLHYHTFAWTDYDGDGKFWWNQAKTFMECKDDFDFTLAQYLLEEQIFPVSFRSGWHYMDNDWQNYLNELLPYSLHDDWPAVRLTDPEPIDNIFDWSKSSSEFIPFNPSPDNYQLQGNSKSWNVRSKYMGSVSQQLVNDIFFKASQGTDQLVCFWSHLPDQSFLNEIQQVHTLLQQASADYPSVEFKYCSAVEAYKLWLKSDDDIKPNLQITEQLSGSEVKFVVSTDKPIFQIQPFIAIKDRYERYTIAKSEQISQNSWRTVSSFPVNEIGKVGVAVTDTIGNLATAFINYLPDDKFIDNNDSQYSEVYGSWTTSMDAAWDLDSRTANLSPGDSAKIRWELDSTSSGLNNIFVQFPQIQNQIDTVYFSFVSNGEIKSFTAVPIHNEFNTWLYVLTANVKSGDYNYIEMSSRNNSQTNKIFSADALKLSAYVRDRQLVTNKNFINIGEISVEDTAYFNLEISNTGNADLTVTNIFAKGKNVFINSAFPIVISSFSKLDLPLSFTPNEVGIFEDTVTIISDDPIHPEYKIPFIATVQNYFRIVDNEDSEIYSESGSWFTSVAQAYGPSSRYAYIQSSTNGPTAIFNFTVTKNGVYDIYEILPTTTNSANNALYKILSGGVTIDSFYLNQNEESGAWKKIGQYFFEKENSITIKVIDSGESTAGPVIRADAFKINLIEEITDVNDDKLTAIPNDFHLAQNYPNPFNPSTTIRWHSPKSCWQTLKIFDVLGNEISTIVNEYKPAGEYEVDYNAANLISGVYFYQLKAGDFTATRKMILLK
jgi:hypothetical protein